MSAHEPTNDPQSPVALPGEERDLLVSRIVDGCADSADWASFRAAAAREPEIWLELGDTQRNHEGVCDELSDVWAIADGVELPGGLIDDAPVRRRLDTVSRFGGWAAAAALLLVWFFGGPINKQPDPRGPGQSMAGLVPTMALSEAPSEQAFDRYLKAGRQRGTVVAEMPEQVVIETRPRPDGTIEVLYLRQVIERQIVERAYREMLDEAGNAYTVPVRLEPVRRQSF